jgi:hypothetical protein
VRAGDLDLDGDTRSEGGTVDIGADEFVIHPFTIQSESVPGAEAITLTLIGQPGVAYTWERSTNLTDWSPVETQSSREGVVSIEQGVDEAVATHRAVSR